MLSPSTTPKSAPRKGPIRVGMMSLGCPKTLVDSEVILGKIAAQKAFRLVPGVEDCDIALLNTCAFIGDAQKESVDKILELVELKKMKQIRALVVMGCLVQRFPQELQKELKEVDAFVGSGDYARIAEIVSKVTEGDKVFSLGAAGYLSTAEEPRVALTPRHFRYVKISEGCDHVCTFCTIPSFRGKHRSRTTADVVAESRRFLDDGCRELILTGQDTTFFGRDRSGTYELPALLRSLDALKGEFWIRLLYAYPSCVTRELMETLRDSQHVCHYLDMPLQHASDRILQSMQRGITRRRTADLIAQFRATVPDLAIRTTFIVGFPGETDKDFEELVDFIRETRFERLGVFTYSQEEGTPSGVMENQVPEKVKKERMEAVMLLQQSISEQNHRLFLGKTLEVLVDGPSPRQPGIWNARSAMDAPDIDGAILVRSSKPLEAGTFNRVRITETKAYDLLAEILPSAS